MATIRYTVPDDTRVTLTIFDASGRIVQGIVSNAENTAGSYEALWDGTAADGTKMPSGTYICRLSTPQGSTEQQIKITR
jgi:flagellar hook assembly protein FlgD